MKKKIPASTFEDLGFAKLDLHRKKRKGFPEVVFCEGKTTEQIVKCARHIYRANKQVMLTRVSAEQARSLKRKLTGGKYFREARIFHAGKVCSGRGLVVVLTAGTGDIPVAEEAAVTARITGSNVKKIYDVGVAGIHRLINHRRVIESARVLVVVAGMDGVLPSVTGGLFSRPVIAVPTSVGYGAHLNGLAPLLTMLNTCAPGVAVVNIDNGFGAGYIASIINQP
jgi:NCAIR mutase (PurE)-related protein